MSNILRRPMFRGGRVSSYGNGIASGMGYNKGGRVGLNVGGSPGNSLAYIQNLQRAKDAALAAGETKTGGSILQNALSRFKSVPVLGRLATPFLGAAGSAGAAGVGAASAGIALGGLTDWIYEGMSTPEKYIETKRIGGEEPFAYAETDLIVDEDGNMTSRGQQIDEYLNELNVGEKPGFFPRGGPAKWMKDKGYDPKTGKKISDMPYEVSGGITEVLPGESALDAILRKATKNPEQDNKDGPQPTALTKKEQLARDRELYREELGYDKARQRDVGDMLGRASAAFLRRPARGEKREMTDALGDFMAAETAAGAGRAEKINQAAATLAINDYIAGKRSKEQTEQILAKTKFGVDYTLSAQAGAENVKTKEWVVALGLEAKNLKEDITKDTVIRNTLIKKFEQPTHIINAFNNKPYSDIANNLKELRVGFNIVKYKGGKIIIEKAPDGSVKRRDDLTVSG